MTSFLKVKDWEQFQHYKDRSPPWIKLHRELLDNYNFSRMQDASKAHLMLIWLLASQLDNRIPNDAAWISRKVGSIGLVDIKSLVQQGFLVIEDDASGLMADCPLETEAYSEEEETPPIPPPTELLTTITKAAETKRRAREDVSAEFEEIWSTYPGGRPKGNKEQAFRIYQKTRKDTSHGDILAGALAYSRFCGAGNYNQHCSTWLNQSGWRTDWLAQLGRSSRPNGTGHQGQPARSPTPDDIAELKRQHGSGAVSTGSSPTGRPGGPGSGDRHPRLLLEDPSPLREAR